MNNRSFFDIEKDFGCNVFGDSEMRKRLTADVYKSLKKTIEEGEHLDWNIAESVAKAMKEWAMERGATHFTHWFQPLNGLTAEKHEAFLAITKEGRAISEFRGKELNRGEPDASSFPSGGLRVTFEARGYTAWDCTSPAFLKENASGVTLCIPTAFCSYNGEALDEKTPLLRSMRALNDRGLELLRLLGNTTSKKFFATVGAEQEYFLINREMYKRRKDLVFCDRTLIGAEPPKGQNICGHYYGSIKEKISSYMKELDIELWKMGVSAKTKHNEAAPAQHELAPIHTAVNVACDQNQIMMETMVKVADHYGLTCLLHEKPFEYINGSGKHNNWSLTTDDGIQIFKPGKDPAHNMLFLLFMSLSIAAFDKYAPLLRLSAATPGNDHRLGGHEAPPAVISVFLGSEFTSMLECIEKGEEYVCCLDKKMNTGVNTLPEINTDNTDRNRTSPLAFTGNKFEFRMLPSSVSISFANTILNTIMADEIEKAVSRLKGATDIEREVFALIGELISRHKRIIFNGNGYSKEWLDEAKRRGLPCAANMVDAIEEVANGEYYDLFERQGVLNKSELDARCEIMLENYANRITVEGKTLLMMVKTEIIPAVGRYLKELCDTLIALKTVCDDDSTIQKALIKEIEGDLNELYHLTCKLEAIVSVKSDQSALERAVRLRDSATKVMKEIRVVCDRLETKVDDRIWPIPTYEAMLFNI